MGNYSWFSFSYYIYVMDLLTKTLRKVDAFNRGKRVMVTIPNPSAKVETNKPFIRVTAKEAGWKKQEAFRMKQEG